MSASHRLHMRRCPVHLLALSGAAVGCPGSHTSGIDEIPADTPLNTLTEEQWGVVCEWRASLREGAPLEYWCDGATPSPERCDGTACRSYDWRAESCQPSGFRFYSRRPECQAVLSDFVRCVSAEAENVCYYVDFPTAECEAAVTLCEAM